MAPRSRKAIAGAHWPPWIAVRHAHVRGCRILAGGWGRLRTFVVVWGSLAAVRIRDHTCTDAGDRFGPGMAGPGDRACKALAAVQSTTWAP